MGIAGEHQGTIMNLVAAESRPAQDALLKIANEKPEVTLREARHLRMPNHHDVRAEDVSFSGRPIRVRR
jgi:hypothetical protein